jgi:hypothetical protein
MMGPQPLGCVEWGRRYEPHNEGDRVARISLVILVAVMIMLFAVVFAVLGKGEYQPPPPEGEEEHGVISSVLA